MRFFLAINQKPLNVGKIREYYEERVFFRGKKKRFNLLKAFFTKWEDAKYAGGSRPSCCFISALCSVFFVIFPRLELASSQFFKT